MSSGARSVFFFSISRLWYNHLSQDRKEYILTEYKQIAESKTLTEMENGPEKASETESERETGTKRERGREIYREKKSEKETEREKVERYREIINLFSCHLFVGDILLNHIFLSFLICP